MSEDEDWLETPPMMAEDLNEGDESVMEYEEVTTNWWEKMAPSQVDVAMGADQREIDVKNQIWILFLQYSQLECNRVPRKKKFNPYKPSTQEVADFLNFLQVKQLWPDHSHPDQCLSTLSAYLPGLALPSSVFDLMTQHQPSEGVENLAIKKLSTLSPYNSTWSNFSQYCEIK